MNNNSSVPNSGDPDTRTQTIERITMKMPPFSSSHPALWFVQLESHFHTARITLEETKFHHVIAAMETCVLEQVMDIVEQPPQDPYATIKKRIIKLFDLSPHQRQQRLMTECFLGDKKPSQLLLEMKKFAKTDFSDEMVKSLWISRLPTAMQPVLAASSEPLSSLSSLADSIHTLPSAAISSVDNPSVSEVLSDLHQEIQKLAQEVSQLKCFSPSPRIKNRRNFHYGGQSVCHYHQKFGNRARKCEQPCSFPKSKNL
uniref:DUF7041 domain-containing protein n=1 Tax=Cacopsylla melanoneura TaxID=428564 RepID=A0A8D8PRZ1_9HEMI